MHFRTLANSTIDNWELQAELSGNVLLQYMFLIFLHNYKVFTITVHKKQFLFKSSSEIILLLCFLFLVLRVFRGLYANLVYYSLCTITELHLVSSWIYYIKWIFWEVWSWTMKVHCREIYGHWRISRMKSGKSSSWITSYLRKSLLFPSTLKQAWLQVSLPQWLT